VLDQAIAIRTTPGRLAISQGPARLAVQQPPAQVAIEQQTQPFAIRTRRAQVSVDSTVPRQEAGYFQPVAYSQHSREESIAASQEAIAQTVQTGDALRESAQRGHSVPRQTAGNPQHDWKIAFKPQSRPKIDFSEPSTSIDIGYAPPRIQISPRRPIVEVQAESTTVAYTPGSLSIHLRPAGILGGLLDTMA
jgi:hypothetical protein